MKRIAVAALMAAFMMSSAIIFGPMAFGTDASAQNGITGQQVANRTIHEVAMAGQTDGAWHRPPANASINMFLASPTVALVSAR